MNEFNHGPQSPGSLRPVCAALNSGLNKGKRRLWIEGQRLTDAGFHRGLRYSLTVDETAGRITLTLDPNGKRKVSGKRKRGVVADPRLAESEGAWTPIIDITGSVLAWLGDAPKVALNVVFQTALIIATRAA